MNRHVAGRRRHRSRLAAVAAVVALVVAPLISAPAGIAAAPADNAAAVTLAGPISPAAPDARQPATTITIPLKIRNTSSETIYNVRVGSLRSAPITTVDGLFDAFRGERVTAGGSTQDGPTQNVGDELAAGATVTVDYVVDSTAADTGICLCFLGIYALDLDVTAASSPDGRRALVGRTQTYLPSLTDDQQERGAVGWLWPLLDRPHRAVDGTVFTDDALATSVNTGGRLDRALHAVELLDAGGTDPTSLRAVLLLTDPELIAELQTMTTGYRVTQPDGSTVAGAGGPVAGAWLARLAAVVTRHDVRFTVPSDPDVVGLAARGLAPSSSGLSGATATGVAASLGLTDLPAHDLAWPAAAVDTAGLAALEATGATALVEPGRAIETGSLADAAATGNGGGTSGAGAVPALVGDDDIEQQAAAATAFGANSTDTAVALQRLVVTTAMTGVLNADRGKYTLVTTPRALDVDPGTAVRAIAATLALGTPQSPLSALQASVVDAPAVEVSTDGAGSPVAAAIGAAVTATATAEALKSAAVGNDVDTVIGDLGDRIQRATSLSWPADGAAYTESTDALAALTSRWQQGVAVVVGTDNSYSLASEDAPLLLTVANNLPITMRVRVAAATVSGAQGFRSDGAEVEVPAGSRQTLQVPTTVTRSGRFDVAVTLHSPSGQTFGAPVQLSVTSTAVGIVGQIVTYGAGVLLVLALLVRGVRRYRRRRRAGSPGTSGAPDAPEEVPTVPAAP